MQSKVEALKLYATTITNLNLTMLDFLELVSFASYIQD
jgi:hypothetical protein